MQNIFKSLADFLFLLYPIHENPCIYGSFEVKKTNGGVVWQLNIFWQSIRERPVPEPWFLTRPAASAGMAQKEFEQIYPQPGWVEHNPMEILETEIFAMRRAVREAGLSSSDIAALVSPTSAKRRLRGMRAPGRAGL